MSDTTDDMKDVQQWEEEPYTEPVEVVQKEFNIATYFPTATKLKLTRKQKAILAKPPDIKDVQIMPDSVVYLPWVHYAKKLNEAFNAEWAQIPEGEPRRKEKMVVRKYHLIVQGVWISEAWGDSKYYETNERMTYVDCVEATRSDALRKNCKPLGVYLEMWDRGWLYDWQKEYAEQVSAINRKGTHVKIWVKKGIDITLMGYEIPHNTAETGPQRHSFKTGGKSTKTQSENGFQKGRNDSGGQKSEPPKKNKEYLKIEKQILSDIKNPLFIGEVEMDGRTYLLDKTKQDIKERIDGGRVFSLTGLSKSADTVARLLLIAEDRDTKDTTEGKAPEDEAELDDNELFAEGEMAKEEREGNLSTG